MKQADFRYLNPQIQDMYRQTLQYHEGEIARKEQAMIDAKNEFVPIGGAMITCSMHLPDPTNPGKTKQVRVPYQALDWLVKNLEKQGMAQERLEDMNAGSMADITQQMLAGRQGAQQLPGGDPNKQMIGMDGQPPVDAMVGQANDPMAGQL